MLTFLLQLATNLIARRTFLFATDILTSMIAATLIERKKKYSSVCVRIVSSVRTSTYEANTHQQRSADRSTADSTPTTRNILDHILSTITELLSQIDTRRTTCLFVTIVRKLRMSAAGKRSSAGEVAYDLGVAWNWRFDRCPSTVTDQLLEAGL